MQINIDINTWQDNSSTIKTFLEQEDDYKQLCNEVSFTLEKAIEKNKIEYSNISFRTKSLKSFLEKCERKIYNEPFTEITDFAGVRLVFLYQSDYINLDKLVYEFFNVIEKVDKLNNKSVDQFGYGAVHYIVKLKNEHSGPRYDSLKNLKCELQVRTVLQDAWSIIDHHLVYKNESEVPSQLRRKLNSLAGLFEIADDQFNQIRNERSNYINKIEESIKNSDTFLDTEFNIDSFTQYIKYRFEAKDYETHVLNAKAGYLIAKRYFKEVKNLREIDIALKFEKNSILYKNFFKDFSYSRINQFTILIHIIFDLDESGFTSEKAREKIKALKLKIK